MLTSNDSAVQLGLQMATECKMVSNQLLQIYAMLTLSVTVHKQIDHSQRFLTQTSALTQQPASPPPITPEFPAYKR